MLYCHVVAYARTVASIWICRNIKPCYYYKQNRLHPLASILCNWNGSHSRCALVHLHTQRVPERLLEESSYMVWISLSIIEASVFSDKPSGSTGSCSRNCPDGTSGEQGVWMLFTMYRWFALLLYCQVWNKHLRIQNILVSGRH